MNNYSKIRQNILYGPAVKFAQKINGVTTHQTKKDLCTPLYAMEVYIWRNLNTARQAIMNKSLYE